MNKSLAREDTRKLAKYDLLQESKKRIKEAWANSIESIWVIGRELIRIDEEGLNEAEGKDFREYVEFDLNLTYDVAKRWMRAWPVLDLLKQHRLQLPSNESQMIELAKLDPEKMVSVWEKIVSWGTENKHPLTYDLVKEAVTAQRQKDGEFLTRAREKKPRPKGIDIDLSTNGEVTSAASYSEIGERALNRIRRLCGDSYADAVLSENPKVTEGDMIRWSEQESEMVKNLGYWIVIKRWSLKKALAYEEKTIDEGTTVEQLGDLARSRGGRAYAEWQDVRITVEIAS